MAKRKIKRRRVANQRVISGSVSTPTNKDAKEVAKFMSAHQRPDLNVGKPRPVVMGSMRSKMANLGGGVMVNVGSIQSFSANSVSEVYTASKAAILTLTLNIAVKHDHQNILANTV